VRNSTTFTDCKGEEDGEKGRMLVVTLWMSVKQWSN